MMEMRKVNPKLITNWKGDDATAMVKRKRAQRWYSLESVSCEKCGAPATERHHRDGNTGNNEPSNIAPLCRRCHITSDGRLARLHSISTAFNRGRKKSAEHIRKMSIARRGKPHPKLRKLTAEQVREIRQLKGIVSNRALAARYGIGKTAIWKIQTGQRYCEISA